MSSYTKEDLAQLIQHAPLLIAPGDIEVAGLARECLRLQTEIQKQAEVIKNLQTTLVHNTKQSCIEIAEAERNDHYPGELRQFFVQVRSLVNAEYMHNDCNYVFQHLANLFNQNTDNARKTLQRTEALTNTLQTVLTVLDECSEDGRWWPPEEFEHWSSVLKDTLTY